MSRTPTSRKTAYALAPLALLVAVASFGAGMRTAGDISAIPSISADDNAARGDVDGDGTVGASDAILILEISQKYRVPTIAELRADPNGNGALTVDDAIRVLRSLPR